MEVHLAGERPEGYGTDGEDEKSAAVLLLNAVGAIRGGGIRLIRGVDASVRPHGKRRGVIDGGELLASGSESPLALQASRWPGVHTDGLDHSPFWQEDMDGLPGKQGMSAADGGRGQPFDLETDSSLDLADGGLGKRAGTAQHFVRM